jgi:hypothetical protein
MVRTKPLENYVGFAILTAVLLRILVLQDVKVCQGEWFPTFSRTT